MVYAIEAVKQGSTAIGLISKTRVLFVSVNKKSLEFFLHQKKIFKANDPMGEGFNFENFISNILRVISQSAKLPGKTNCLVARYSIA
ncbi:Proteasome subunit alpha type-6 [Castilleja foliolosa]|uniref:Proteasome subunit alpha type-6 n=1 Tax=Castilleja foliolosa TaxID=1961234 RepID=A0ABD3CF91_9LAMI